MSKEVLLWFHFLAGPITIWKQNPEFPRADMLPLVTTAIHSRGMKHSFFRVMCGWNKEMNSFCIIECELIWRWVTAHCQPQYFRELLPLWNWEGCGRLDVVSFPGMGTLCWARGPGGPLGLHLDCVSLGHRKTLVPSILAAKRKGKRKVLDC